MQYKSCIVGVALFNVLVAVVLGAALGLRYGLYRDNQHRDMPSDMRVADRSQKTIFCKEHVVSAKVEGTRQGDDPPMSNSMSTFDVYVSDKDPEATVSPYREYEELPGTTQLSPGKTRNHGFRMLRGTSLTLDVCTQYDSGPNPGVTLYLIRSYKNFTKVQDRLREDDVGDYACPSSLCVSSWFINTTHGLCSAPVNNVTSLTLQFPETDAFYFLYYYRNTEVYPQRLRTLYKLNRTRVASPGILKQRHVQKTTVSNRKYVAMDFRYFHQDPENELTNIIITFECVPNIMVYLAFFFFLPLILAALLVCFVVRFAGAHDDDYRPLINTVQDYR